MGINAWVRPEKKAKWETCHMAVRLFVSDCVGPLTAPSSLMSRIESSPPVFLNESVLKTAGSFFITQILGFR